MLGVGAGDEMLVLPLLTVLGHSLLLLLVVLVSVAVSCLRSMGRGGVDIGGHEGGLVTITVSNVVHVCSHPDHTQACTCES